MCLIEFSIKIYFYEQIFILFTNLTMRNWLLIEKFINLEKWYMHPYRFFSPQRLSLLFAFFALETISSDNKSLTCIIFIKVSRDYFVSSEPRCGTFRIVYNENSHWKLFKKTFNRRKNLMCGYGIGKRGHFLLRQKFQQVLKLIIF